jgi:hypothetical protein
VSVLCEVLREGTVTWWLAHAREPVYIGVIAERHRCEEAEGVYAAMCRELEAECLEAVVQTVVPLLRTYAVCEGQCGSGNCVTRAVWERVLEGMSKGLFSARVGCECNVFAVEVVRCRACSCFAVGKEGAGWVRMEDTSHSRVGRSAHRVYGVD